MPSFDDYDEDFDESDVCPHGLGFDEYCEDCDDEEFGEYEDSDED